MRGYVLIADAVQSRAAARAAQLELDGWSSRIATDPGQAREMAAEAEVLVIGEFRGSAALANELVRDLRAGRIRGADPSVRVVATADGDGQTISALRAGADLTVPRAATATLVAASVDALVRRPTEAREDRTVRLGGVEIDPEGRRVTVAGEAVRLTGKELDVLVALADTPGRVFTRDELSWKVWGGPDIKSSRALDSHVSRMSLKFRAAGASGVVENVWGRGYKLTSEGGVQR